MQPFPINYTNQNQGYYVFIHEDNSPVDVTTELSSTNANDGLEWDEEVVEESSVEDDTWASLYTYYAQMLEQTDGVVESSNNALKGIINHVDIKQRGAAHYAAEQGHAGVLRLLLQTDCKIDASDTEGMTPLHLAVKFGQESAVKVLLEATANPNRYTSNADHNTALHIAAAYGHPQIIDLLVSAGALLEVRDGDERTPLHLAIEERQTEAALKLLELGSNINVENVRGTTPLCEAIWQEIIEIVAALLKAGARIPPHQYLLHYAVMHRQVEIVKLLAEHGSSINLRNEEGDTPLLVAATGGYTDIARILLDHGASVDYPNSLTGSTALHVAVGSSDDFSSFQELFKCLQEHKVNLNAMCFTEGDTPLFRAIILERDSIAKLLIKHGADVNLCSLHHCVIDNLSLAIAQQSNSVAHMLVLAGAHPPKNWMKGPRPLTHLARLVLRNKLPSRSLYKSIQELPLPNLLKKFLMFENEE